MTDSSDDEESIAILQKERNGRNKIGEIDLHELARSDDYQALKNAIAKGGDVNKRDNGSWTPLSEAVSFGKIQNVRLLLMKGARVNVKSTECLTDENGDKTTASGLTPLMEASINGDLNMIKLLLQYKADVVARDDDDWTAIDHLREFLVNAVGLDPARRESLEDLIRRMEDLHQKGGAKPRTKNEFIDLLELKRFRQKKHSQTQSGPSTSSSSRKTDNSSASLPNSLDGDLMSGTRKRRAVISSDSDDSDVEETRNLNEYRTTIEGLRRKHKTRPSSSAKPAAVPKRKKSQLAKRMFFNIQ